MSTSDLSPGIPAVTEDDLDAMVEDVRPDPEAELEQTEYDTDLGLDMAEDAKRVSKGEISSETF
ncbi:MAG: 4Fe-4S ferredoxin N-terminal domain-containing protein, partial [Halodesulfurarchaeum sp.]